MSTLPVVVLPYEMRAQALRGVERVAEQSRRAREALALAATSVGARLDPLEKSADDVPLPTNGWHWSLSHGTQRVAATLARAPIGIDIEWIRPRSQSIVPRVTSREEVELLGGFSWESFFRVWTAKEAVLKKSGCGILELSACTLVTVADERSLVLRHRERNHFVRQMMREDHVVSIACDDIELSEIDWRWTSTAGAAP